VTAPQAERVKSRALETGGPGWVPAVVAANLALDELTWRSRRPPTLILPPTPYVPVPKCAAFWRWKLGRGRPPSSTTHHLGGVE